MFRRANAPFKPPRPLGSTATTEKTINSSSLIIEPLIPDELAHLDRVTNPNISHSNISKPVQPHVKRIKVGLVRKQSFNDSADASESPLSQTSSADPDLNRRYYTVQWRKRTNKKNKSWEGDGYIVVTDDGILLKVQVKDGTFKAVGRSKKTSVEGLIGFGSYEAEVDSESSLEEIKRLTSTDTKISPIASRVAEMKNMVYRNPVKKQKPGQNVQEKLFVGETETNEDEGGIDETIASGGFDVTEEINEEKEEEKNEKRDRNQDSFDVTEKESISSCPDIFQVNAQALEFTLPMLGDSRKRLVVDRRLLTKLRSHQREAVTFIYECLTGIRQPGHLGALLADEMGLGKTLTSIAVIWTLLKQSPDPALPPPLKKVLICCPVTLIDNWRREFAKWLDLNRIGILALNGKQKSPAKDKKDIIAFGKTKVYQVLIMGYEKVMTCSNELASVNLDLLVCDEGHRLKSATNKTLQTLESFKIPRKLLLTGTPIQNDLSEYYTIIDFVNPGILGTFSEFQKEYLRPILKAREKGCILKDLLREGKRKSQKLISITKSFVLRRTKDSIRNFLTDKVDVLIFCRLTKFQKSLFDLAISSSNFSSCMGSESNTVLTMINLFKKICNLPSLLENDPLYQQLYMNSAKPEHLMPTALKKRIGSSKINLLVPLLLEFKELGEKTVLISNFTQTLDLFEQSLLKLNMLYLRLDGNTTSSTRDQLVMQFNNSSKIHVFLLSAKAGGVGLNLVGASRLILFDNDWNPLVDQQALARIHRDGQKRPVFIYRLFTAGAIDEKIFQRQLTKITLSDMFVDDNADSNLDIFDYDDLRDLFTVSESSCNTHDLLGCECAGDGTNKLLDVVTNENDADTDEDLDFQSSGFSSALDLRDTNEREFAKRKAFRTALSNYKHYDPSVKSIKTGDAVLDKLIGRSGDDITYCFTHFQAGSRGE